MSHNTDPAMSRKTDRTALKFSFKDTPHEQQVQSQQETEACKGDVSLDGGYNNNHCKQLLKALKGALENRERKEALSLIEKLVTYCQNFLNDKLHTSIKTIETFVTRDNWEDAYQEWKQLQGVLPSKVRHIAQQFKKTSRGRVEETASPSSSSAQLTPPRPVIFAAVVKVKEFESKKDNPASLFGQAFFYWIGEQQQWKTTLQNMGIQKLPNDSELPANKEAELVVTYSTQWRGDFPKNSLAVQIALKKEQPSQSDIYQLPRECNIFNYGFQKG